MSEPHRHLPLIGYHLPALEAALADTVYEGKLHYSAVIDSTNTTAMAEARNGAPHGSVYFADEQLAGRGRGDHTWQSAAGHGLYVSVVLRPDLSVDRLPLLPLAAGLAAADAIHATTGLKIDLRWPNDLLIGPRKVGGILVEAQASPDALSFAVAGIGINVHQPAFNTETATPATSLDLEGAHTTRQLLLIALLKNLDAEMLSLEDRMSIRTVPGRVQQASSWVHGRSVHVHGPQACSGVTAGLNPNGFLLVQTAQGLVTVQTGGLRAADIS